MATTATSIFFNFTKDFMITIDCFSISGKMSEIGLRLGVAVEYHFWVDVKKLKRGGLFLLN